MVQVFLSSPSETAAIKCRADMSLHGASLAWSYRVFYSDQFYIILVVFTYTYFPCVFVITLVTVTMLIIQGEELNGEGSEKYEILDSQVSYLIAA